MLVLKQYVRTHVRTVGYGTLAGARVMTQSKARSTLTVEVSITTRDTYVLTAAIVVLTAAASCQSHSNLSCQQH